MVLYYTGRAGNLGVLAHAQELRNLWWVPLLLNIDSAPTNHFCLQEGGWEGERQKKIIHSHNSHFWLHFSSFQCKASATVILGKNSAVPMALGLKQTEVQATVLLWVLLQRDWAKEQLWVGDLQQKLLVCQNQTFSAAILKQGKASFNTNQNHLNRKEMRSSQGGFL